MKIEPNLPTTEPEFKTLEALSPELSREILWKANAYKNLIKMLEDRAFYSHWNNQPKSRVFGTLEPF